MALFPNKSTQTERRRYEPDCSRYCISRGHNRNRTVEGAAHDWENIVREEKCAVFLTPQTPTSQILHQHKALLPPTIVAHVGSVIIVSFWRINHYCAIHSAQ